MQHKVGGNADLFFGVERISIGGFDKNQRQIGLIGQRVAIGRRLIAAAMPCVGGVLVFAYFQFHFTTRNFRGTLLPPERWDVFAQPMNGAIVFAISILATTMPTLVAIVLGRLHGERWSESALQAGRANLWWLLLLSHQVLYYSATLTDSAAMLTVVVQATPFLVSVALAGWLAMLWQTAFPVPEAGSNGASWWKVAAAATLYAIIYSGLSILQYRALHVPHGDSAMYEEHLWNLLHGKGFRSQLDDGRLFLGEHFQIIHLLLIPIYLLRPSLETMNLCQSLALGSGAIALFLLARRFGLCATASWTIGAAYLLYFPLQYLNLEASWKTFRPTTLGVPLVLFALVALESHRYRTMLLLLSLALLAKEEYALVTAAVGLYIALRRDRGPWAKREVVLGGAVAAISVVFLATVLVVVIPYFRQGAPPHYTPYFASWGASPAEIVTNVTVQPMRVIQTLAAPRMLYFLVLMLFPMGFIPLASPSRLLTAVPIFGYLMLGDLDDLTRPWFHFHAPLIPLLWWSCVAGIANLSARVSPIWLARQIACVSLGIGLWFGASPISWSFFDRFTGMTRNVHRGLPTFEPRGNYWRDRYLSDERAAAFARAFATIHRDERVAATDYVRAHFTHHRAAHDYPTLRAHVTIDDIDVIVLDITEGWWGRGETNPDRQLIDCMYMPWCGPGSEIEIRDRPFEVVYHDAYFLVVRRKERN